MQNSSNATWDLILEGLLLIVCKTCFARLKKKKIIWVAAKYFLKTSSNYNKENIYQPKNVITLNTKIKTTKSCKLVLKVLCEYTFNHLVNYNLDDDIIFLYPALWIKNVEIIIWKL